MTGVDPDKAEQTLLALRHLVADLSLIQTRLGTSQEQPGDCKQARDLGHTIRNKLQALQMWDSLGLMQLPPHLKSMNRVSLAKSE